MEINLELETNNEKFGKTNIKFKIIKDFSKEPEEI